MHGHLVYITGGVGSLEKNQVQEHHSVKLIIPATNAIECKKQSGISNNSGPRVKGGIESCTCYERRWRWPGSSRRPRDVSPCSSGPLPRTSGCSGPGSTPTAASPPHSPTGEPEGDLLLLVFFAQEKMQSIHTTKRSLMRSIDSMSTTQTLRPFPAFSSN